MSPSKNSLAMKPVTQHQRNVLAFVDEYIKLNGYAPSCREIGRAFGLTSTNAVTDLLDRLEAHGLLERPRDQRGTAIARAMKVKAQPPPETEAAP